jgi:hypothetical protein
VPDSCLAHGFLRICTSDSNNLKYTQMTNKKTYTVPEMDVVRIAQTSLIAASSPEFKGLPVEDDENVEGSDKATAFDGGITE